MSTGDFVNGCRQKGSDLVSGEGSTSEIFIEGLNIVFMASLRKTLLMCFETLWKEVVI